MKKILCFTIIFLFATGTANAACTKPSGKYAANSYGQYIDTNNGNYVAIVSTTTTATFASNGSATAVEVGKRAGLFGTGIYTSTWTVPAIATSGNHIFDTVTCRGYFTNSLGMTFVYISTNSGAKLSGTYYGNDNYLFMNSVVFERL